MSGTAKRIKTGAVIFAICLLTTGAGYLNQIRNNLVKNYDAVFDTGLSIDKKSNPVSLPYTEISLGKNNFLALEVPITLGGKANSIYIQHFQGRIEIFENAKKFYGTETNQLNTLNGRNELIIPVPRDTLESRQFILKLFFANNTAKISPVYTGIEELFNNDVAIKDRRIVQVSVSLGAYFLLIILLLSSLLTRTISSEGVPLLFMTFYLLVIGSGNIAGIAEAINYSHRYILPLSPLALVALSEIFRLTALSDNFHLNTNLWLAAALISAFSFIIGVALDLTITDVNTLIAGPLLILFCPFLSLYVVFIASKNISLIGAFTSAIVFYGAFTTIHDGLSRLGVINTTLFLSNGSPWLFITAIAIIYFRLTARVKTQLIQVNQQISTQLNIQSEALDRENQRNIALVEERTALEQRAKLNNELHDGVLTYLAIINSMTEHPESEKEVSLNKLSRNATQEIRIILESDPLSHGSLFQALSSLRNQIFEPLKSLGIRVKWDLTLLLEFHTHRADVMMDTVRILQESIHNAVIRGKCSGLRVSALKARDNRMIIAVLNNGGITYSDSYHKGNGIKNMQRRALQIGGLFSISPRPGGARVLLGLPSNDELPL